MQVTILGGGLAGISLAYFLQDRDDISLINIFEKENKIGGLCRSFTSNGITYDIGPHIIFSKNNAVLELMVNILGDNVHKLRRSNQIIHKRHFIQYPFENDLSKLPPEDKDFCVDKFLDNPHENSKADNMLQFFLKTFGEGITNLYLRPYNEKIWKFDPEFMNTEMVERIPKPPKEDILNSAKGQTIDGYLHQLYFSYPKKNGIESLVASFSQKFNDKVRVFTNFPVEKIEKEKSGFKVTANHETFFPDKIVSTIPVNLLSDIYSQVPCDMKNVAAKLKYNSIIIAIINVKSDSAGNNFAFMLADKKIIFHRLSKLDFLGSSYRSLKGTTYMVEITYHKGDLIDRAKDADILSKIIDGLIAIDFINTRDDVNFADLKRFPYAYVIYDLDHRRNMDLLNNYFNAENVHLHGRFGKFEYLNMDAVIEHSMELAKLI